MDASTAPIVDCSLTLNAGDMAIRLECSCQPGGESAASNALMEEMRTRIVTANNRRLAGLPPVVEEA